MSKQAQVGLFTILALLAMFGVFFVIADLGVRSSGYKIGVQFRGASGLRTSGTVSLSGVPIGVVDNISLLPDFTTEVVLAIKPGFNIPQGSRFLIQAPLTGEASVLIEPPKNLGPNVPTLPHEIAPIGQQPRGTNPTSIAELLEQGQGEVRRLDEILSQLQRTEPELLAQLKSTLINANELTSNANHTLTVLTGKVETLADSLQQNLTLASNNVVDLTGSLNGVVKRDSGRVDTLLAQLTRTSLSFGQTVDSLRDVATNPGVKQNLINTTRDFAATAKTFAALTSDLRSVTGDPQTQHQLRDTIAQLDATSQKVDSLAGSLGGTSSVYGIDPNATPAPAPSPGLPGSAAPPKPSDAMSRDKPSDATSADRHAHSPVDAAPRGAAGDAPRASVTDRLAILRARLNAFTKDLVVLQIRASVLAPQRPGSAARNVSPLLTGDRGPQSDVNVFLLPHGKTGFVAGVNDIGSSGTSTASAMLLNRSGGLTYGGGIEYSRLGVTASIARRALGFETRAYDLRHPTLDSYVNFSATPKLQIFAGERDITHAQRRSVLGLQFEL